jgi:hypothetical protein
MLNIEIFLGGLIYMWYLTDQVSVKDFEKKGYPVIAIDPAIFKLMLETQPWESYIKNEAAAYLVSSLLKTEIKVNKKPIPELKPGDILSIYEFERVEHDEIAIYCYTILI